MSTPEMAGYIQEELNDYAARGQPNKRLRVAASGRSAEAWREDSAEYATVAMRSR